MTTMGTPSEATEMNSGLADIDAEWAAQLKARRDLDQITKSAELGIEEVIGVLTEYRELKAKVHSETDLDIGSLLRLMAAMDRVIAET